MSRQFIALVILLFVGCSTPDNWMAQPCEDPTVYSGPIAVDESTDIGTVASWYDTTSNFDGMFTVESTSQSSLLSTQLDVSGLFELLSTPEQVQALNLTTDASWLPNLSANGSECAPSLDYLQTGNLSIGDSVFSGLLQFTVFDAEASWPFGGYRTEHQDFSIPTGSALSFLDVSTLHIEFETNGYATFALHLEDEAGGRIVLTPSEE